MIINAKKIIGNKVFSRSGFCLGKVVDFEINISGQNIVKYYVSGDFFNLIKEPLIISANQIIEIKENRIIVEDAAIPEKAVDGKKAAAAVEYAK